MLFLRLLKKSIIFLAKRKHGSVKDCRWLLIHSWPEMSRYFLTDPALSPGNFFKCRTIFTVRNYCPGNRCAFLPISPGFSCFISRGCEGQSMLSILTEFNMEQMTYHVLTAAKIQIQQFQTLLLGGELCYISCHSCRPSLNSLL